jgi:hypothetical protein
MSWENRNGRAGAKVLANDPAAAAATPRVVAPAAADSTLIDAWPTLPEAIKAGILAMIKAAAGGAG